MEQFEDKLKEYKASPPSHLWQQLDNKLEHRRNRKRLVKFRNISVAAVLFAIMAVIGVMNLYVQNYNPNLFATSTNFEPLLMEELQESNDGMYKLANLKFLEDSYQRANAFQ